MAFSVVPTFQEEVCASVLRSEIPVSLLVYYLALISLYMCPCIAAIQITNEAR